MPPPRTAGGTPWAEREIRTPEAGSLRAIPSPAFAPERGRGRRGGDAAERRPRPRVHASGGDRGEGSRGGWRVTYIETGAPTRGSGPPRQPMGAFPMPVAGGPFSPTESPRPPLEWGMPDRPDTAIDFYGSPFCKEILDAAHRTRFSRERITYGSDIYGSFRSHVWPTNTLDEIADGRRLVGTRRLPLAKLDAGSRRYGRLLDNMLRPFGRRESKNHYLATYPDDAPVAFTVIDFDRHPPKGRRDPLDVESDEWLAIDEAFWHGVGLFHRLAEEFDLDAMWVTSPGRWLVDGHGLPCRMGGLYAVVRHAPRTPSELRPMLAAAKERHGLDVETSWDTKNRNIRIPGQCFMDACRIDPDRRTIVPTRDPDARTERERNMARLAAVVEAYGGLRRGGGERLLRAGAERAAKGLATSPTGECGQPGRVARPTGGDATGEKRGSGSARKARTASDNTDPARWLREPDTFRALHGSGLLRQALRLFGWDHAQSGEAVSWMAPRFRGLRPSSSATCSDDRGLAAFLRKHYLWGCRTYDERKAKGNARARARAGDEARIASSLRIGDKALEAYLRVVAGLSRAEMESVRRFRTMERRWAGRISCRALYAAFGGRRRFAAFRRAAASRPSPKNVRNPRAAAASGPCGRRWSGPGAC